MALPVRAQNSSRSHFVVCPTTIAEAMDYAKMIAASCFCPKDMKGKPGDVMVAMQMGAEIGLSPIQALQNVAVINGKPCVYGDAALAVVIGSPHYVSHREWTEGSIDKGNLTAFCGITRRNSDEYVKSFSMEEAKKAGLWSKSGVWQQYPSRMLQMRARAFAIRDKFADALRGINVREEVEDYSIGTVVRAINTQRPQLLELQGDDQIPDRPSEVRQASPTESLKIAFDGFIDEIEAAANLKGLQTVFNKCKMIDWKGSEYLSALIDAKDAKKSQLSTETFLQEFDGETGEVGEVKE